MSTRIMFTLIVVALLSSCQQTTTTEQSGTTISGTMKNASGKTLFFQMYDGSGGVDSAVVAEDGSYSMNVDSLSLDFYKLFFDKKSQVVLILDSTDTDIKVSADAENIPATMTVEGSKDSELMISFFKMQMGFNSRVDSLNQLVRSMDSSMGEIRQALSRQLANEKMEFEKEMAGLAQEHSSSPAVLSLMPMITPSNHIPTLEKVHKDLSVRMPDSQFVTSLKTQIAQAKQKKSQTAPAGQVAIGTEAPELELADPDGKMIPLSSLRGKYVLLDFWASWCGPCRRENPSVKRMYDKYKKEDFEIYGISFDSKKDRWLKAIAQDDLPWVHVSDLKKWQSVAAGIYGVRSIPYTVLVDPEGTVVATKLRGSALDNKMAEIFGY